MSNIKINGGLSYTIPVDSMDLNYLSKYVGSTSQMKPLWTKTRMNGEGGYCQVQILSQNEEECHSEPTETYECHICNVHVPVICSVEHNKSEKHKTIKNIFQKVLEKLSKQIDTNIVEHDEKIDKEAYYCVPCSKIIKKENKDTHELTEFHAKSNKDTIIISEFYKIINEDISHTDVIISNDERLDIDSDFEAVNTKSSIVNNNNTATNNNFMNNELVITGPTNNDYIVQPPSDEKTETFDEYLKSMIKKYKLKVNLPKMMSDKILIESNGDVVKVSPEHFQSYKQMKNSIYCQLCKVWISQKTRAHEVTENHVRNIFKPINEKFARTIDIVSSHCVPCNVVVLTNYDYHHTLDENHRKIVKDTCVQRQGPTFCEDCHLYIDTHDFAAHITSKKHMDRIMIQNFLSTTASCYYVFCTVCLLYVHTTDINNHVVDKMHLKKKNNDDTKIVKNGATDLGNTECTKINDKNTKSAKINDKSTGVPATGINKSDYCEICKVDVPFGGMETHVNGKQHKDKIIQLNQNDIKAKENKDKNGNGSPTSTNLATRWSASSCPSDSNASNMSDANIDEYYDQLEYTNNSETEVRCKICPTDGAFVERLIIDHMESIVHVKNATRKKRDRYKKYFNTTDDAKTMFCWICNVKVPNLDGNIIEHVEGSNHGIADTGLLEFHHMKKDRSVYFCECCEENTEDSVDHIFSKSHINTLILNEKIDKKELKKYVYVDYSSDLVPRCYRGLYDLLLEHNDINKLNDTSYYCGMCQIKLGRICELDHVLGARHALKLEELTNIYNVE